MRRCMRSDQGHRPGDRKEEIKIEDPPYYSTFYLSKEHAQLREETVTKWPRMGYIPLGYAKNMCRIQVAEAFLNRLSKKTKASSAGTEPVEYIDPKAVEVMRESASK